MEYLNLNESSPSVAGEKSFGPDLLSVELKSYNNVNSSTSNGSNLGRNISVDGELDSFPGLNYQNTDRLVGIFFLIICTIAGNITLIVALTYKRSRRIKRVNIFLVNLAVSDLAVAFITMTSEILFIAFGEWVLGPIICKISVYLEVVTLAAATFLLTAMSIDRYQVIVKPLESLTNRPKIWTKVTVAWCLAFMFAIPQAFIFMQVTEYSDHDDKYKHACKSKGYKAEWQRKLYFTFFTCYILVIPTIIMTFCYLKIMKVIWSRSESGVNTAKSGSSISPRMSVNRNLVSSSRRKVIILTLTVIIGFLVCLMPYFIVSLVRIYSSYRIKLTEYLPTAEMIFMLHSALNPILFGIFTLRMDHLSCLVPRYCKTCLFHDLKDKSTSSNFSQQKGQDGVKTRLMSSVAKQQHSSTRLRNHDNSSGCAIAQRKIEKNVLNKDTECVPLCKHGLRTTIVVDAKPNGNLLLHTKTVQSLNSVPTSHVNVGEMMSVDDKELLTTGDYNIKGTDTGGICNSVNRELTEYVSCV